MSEYCSNTGFSRSALMALGLWAIMTTGGRMAWAADPVLPEAETFLVSQSVSVPGGHKLTTIDVQNYSIRLLLNELAEQAGFNLILDDSVKGSITVSLKRVSVNNALDALTTLAGVEIFPQGSVYLVVAKDQIEEKGLMRSASKILPLKYGSAARLAEFFNQTLFGDTQHIQAEARTNSLIVIGTPQDIAKVEKALERFDVKRHSKTFYLSHANALDVATLISSSIFNDGSNPINLGGGAGGAAGGAGGAGGGAGAGGAGGAGGNASGGGLLGSAAQPSPLQVEKETLTEGSGTNDFAVGGSNTTVSQTLKIRTLGKATQTISISPAGPLVVPNTRINAITIMGTLEQIAQVEKILPVLDAQVPQVAIEASLVELSQEGTKALGGEWGTSNNRLEFGFGNRNTSIGLPTANSVTGTRTALQFSTETLNKPPNLALAISALIQERKAKILANPTVIASHDTEAVISIVDEVVRRITVTLDGTTGTITRNVELGDVGIILDILPRVGEDGSINMRIRPSVSTVRQVTADSVGNTITLLNRRDMLSQNVRIKDAQTLVLGGLIQENTTLTQSKLPLLGDSPLIAALFRASSRTHKRTELVMLITPHILSPFRQTEVHSAVSAQILPPKTPSPDLPQVPQVPQVPQLPKLTPAADVLSQQQQDELTHSLSALQNNTFEESSPTTAHSK